jgi:hypothetical protein
MIRSYGLSSLKKWFCDVWFISKIDTYIHDTFINSVNYLSRVLTMTVFGIVGKLLNSYTIWSIDNSKSLSESIEAISYWHVLLLLLRLLHYTIRLCLLYSPHMSSHRVRCLLNKCWLLVYMCRLRILHLFCLFLLLRGWRNLYLFLGLFLLIIVIIINFIIITWA